MIEKIIQNDMPKWPHKPSAIYSKSLQKSIEEFVVQKSIKNQAVERQRVAILPARQSRKDHATPLGQRPGESSCIEVLINFICCSIG